MERIEGSRKSLFKRYGTLKVRVVLHFEKDHLILPTVVMYQMVIGNI